MPLSDQVNLEYCESGTTVWVDAKHVSFPPARDPKCPVLKSISISEQSDDIKLIGSVLIFDILIFLMVLLSLKKKYNSGKVRS